MEEAVAQLAAFACLGLLGAAIALLFYAEHRRRRRGAEPVSALEYLRRRREQE